MKTDSIIQSKKHKVVITDKSSQRTGKRKVDFFLLSKRENNHKSYLPYCSGNIFIYCKTVMKHHYNICQNAIVEITMIWWHMKKRTDNIKSSDNYLRLRIHLVEKCWIPTLLIWLSCTHCIHWKSIKCFIDWHKIDIWLLVSACMCIKVSFSWQSQYVITGVAKMSCINIMSPQH